MEETCVHTVELKNGLKLEIFDASRKIAGDRYQIVMSARIEVDVAEAMASPAGGGVDPEAVVAALGPKVIFEQKGERNFIDEKEKEAVFNALCDACLDNAGKYFAHDDFAVKYVLRTYRVLKTQHS
ncbi:MAG: hypothetical protein JEZ11_19670 [Desulfobacterales bacterium]|nr:hypothetical protein [Desulfobacterales bacterium]